MSIEQNTGKPARLSLSKRATQRLLLSESELSLSDLLELEHPTDHAARMALSRAIKAAIAYGDLAASIRQWERPGLTVNRDWLRLPPLQHKPTQCSEHLLERETYRQWRAQCPAELLLPLPLSKIKKWLGDPPAESILPVGTSLPELPGPARLTEAQQDKADCQAIARALWAEQPGATQADILKNSRIKPYLKTWPGKNTLPGWLSEVDPRPKEQRRGRPKAR